MGLFEGRTRVKRATTAPHANLSLDAYISNNKLGKRISKACMEAPEPDGELPGRRLRLPGYPPTAAAARALRHRADPDPPPPPPPLTNGCNGHVVVEPARRRLTEAQKLLLSSECHKTEIFASKLRHIPGRPLPPPPPHRNGERPRRRRRSEPDEPPPPPPGPPAKKRVTLDSLLLRDNHEYYKVEILSGKLRSSRLSGESDGKPEKLERLEVDTPDDVGPEDSCDSFRVVRRVPGRRPRGAHCGTPHGCRPAPAPAPPAAAESDSDGAEEPPAEEEASAADRQLEFTFESSPGGEQWYQTMARQSGGEDVVGRPPAAEPGPRLPYQMSREELFPPEAPPNGAVAGGAARAKHRRLLQLSDSARKSPRCHASTRAARCSVDAAEGVALWDSSLEQVQLVAASISSILTAAQEQHEPWSVQAHLGAGEGRRRRRRTASAGESAAELPAHLSGVSLSPPEAPDLASLLRAEPIRPSPPAACPAAQAAPRQTVAAAPQRRQPAPRRPAPSKKTKPPPRKRQRREERDESESEAEEAAGRRRAGRRRSNRTGWPRPARSRARRAVSRAAATVRAARAARRSR